MITKITPRLTSIAKQPVRANLQKTAVAGLAVLAGSSMSDWSGGHIDEVQRIIPGGLDFLEYAYFKLRGKLPQSVYDRWVAPSQDYIPGSDDEVVTVKMQYDRYILSVVEPPHAIGTTPTHDDYVGCGQDISGDVTDAVVGDASDLADTDSSDGDSGMSALEIFKHLAGYHD